MELGRTINEKEWSLANMLWSTEQSRTEASPKLSLLERGRKLLSKLRHGTDLSEEGGAYNTNEQLLALYKKIETLASGNDETGEKLFDLVSNYFFVYNRDAADFRGMRPVELLAKVLELAKDSDEGNRFIVLLYNVIGQKLIKDNETVAGVVDKFQDETLNWKDMPNQEHKKKQKSERKPNILVVDDVYDQIRELLTSLARSGYNVRYGLSGESGFFEVEYAHEQGEGIPDLIITDWSMPQMDGIEFSKRLKEAYPNIPVIIRSGDLGKSSYHYRMQGGFILAALDNVVAVSGKVGEDDITMDEVKKYLPVDDAIVSDEVSGSSPIENNDGFVSTTDIPGGIDLNPNNLNLNEQGQVIDINFASFPAILPDQVNGITPVIINITPIVNFPLLLGEAEINDNQLLSQL